MLNNDDIREYEKERLKAVYADVLHGLELLRVLLNTNRLLTQSEAAKALGITQSKISRGSINGFQITSDGPEKE